MGGIAYSKQKEGAFIFYGPCIGYDITDIEMEAMRYISLKISLKWPEKSAVICSDSSNVVKKFQDSKLRGLKLRGPFLGLDFPLVGLDNL